jgi:hypothetical protein
VFKLPINSQENEMAKAGTQKMNRPARLNQEAAAARDAKMADALRETVGLSAERAAHELAQLGFGAMSHMTVRRARTRLGISRPAPSKAAAKPHRRQAAGKEANREITAE